MHPSAEESRRSPSLAIASCRFRPTMLLDAVRRSGGDREVAERGPRGLFGRKYLTGGIGVLESYRFLLSFKCGAEFRIRGRLALGEQSHA